MYYEELRNSIKNGKPAPLYIFEGPEDYLIEFSIAELKKKLIDPSTEMMNYKSYEFIPPVGEAGDFLETLPMMSERKMVVFRKCRLFAGNIKNKAQWEKVLSTIAEYNCVIIWEEQAERGKKPSSVRKAAEANGIVVQFPLRTEPKLRAWVTKIAAAAGKIIDPEDAAYLIATLERKMRVIRTELDKTIAYCEGTKITRADIDAVIVKPSEQSVFDLIDAIFNGRREQCYSLLYELRQNRQEPVSILSLLSGQIINIYRARLYIADGFTSAQAAQKLGGGYGNEKCARKAEKIKAGNLELLINLCFECDKRVKQGLFDPWAALEIIIAEYRFY